MQTIPNSMRRTPEWGGAVERTKFRPTVSGDATRTRRQSQPAASGICRTFIPADRHGRTLPGAEPSAVQSRCYPRVERAMNVIRLTATSGPDGILHLSVPVGAAGEFEVEVVVSPRPAAGGAHEAAVSMSNAARRRPSE